MRSHLVEPLHELGVDRLAALHGPRQRAIEPVPELGVRGNTSGIRKCISDHSSIRLFCSGVPVSRSRRADLNPSSVCHRCDLKF